VSAIRAGIACIMGASALFGCIDRKLDPLPQVLIVVDTNMAVPLTVGRLRVDLYSEDGTWFRSADFSRDQAADWPASFGVFADEGLARGIFARLRAYPEGYLEPYSGEHFRDWDAPLAEPASDPSPRLVVDGVDRTPLEVPTPLVTIDRLVFVRMKPNERGTVRVLLHGACVGTMAKLGPDGRPSLGQSESCTDSEKKREPVRELPLDSAPDAPRDSAVGTWLRANEDCNPDDPDSATVCVPGGPTLFGTVEMTAYLPGNALELRTRPVRVFGLHRFYFDRDEVTVSRVRKAIEAGYTGALPEPNEGPTGAVQSAKEYAECTYSEKPLGRENWAVTCMGWDAARSFCKFSGGDLPTEVQWEHVATVVGSPRKRRYPWGNEAPDCSRSVYDREQVEHAAGECDDLPKGPRPPSESELDVTPIGVRRMFGNVQEWVLDEPTEFDQECWLAAPLVSPSCTPRANAPRRMARGAGYFGAGIRPTFRISSPATAAFGFRCAYSRRP
jgi:formylglycine-generating enzyme required for sulfatase activity